VQLLANAQITPLFNAAMLASEEAIVNALVAAESMTGIDDRTVIALPHDRLREVLKQYNRLQAPP
jgi:L-aminopeptidase/D-esterase-like protein